MYLIVTFISFTSLLFFHISFILLLAYTFLRRCAPVKARLPLFPYNRLFAILTFGLNLIRPYLCIGTTIWTLNNFRLRMFKFLRTGAFEYHFHTSLKKGAPLKRGRLKKNWLFTNLSLLYTQQGRLSWNYIPIRCHTIRILLQNYLLRP